MNESQIFTDALKLASASERAAYLEAVCAGNPQLRAAVEALLQVHANDPGFLEESVGSFEGTVDSPAEIPATSALEAAGLLIAGKYKLIEQIGEGGMGTVWMAQQTEPVKRVVALKLIKAGMDSNQIIARFEAERQALALMEHPNIARVLDAGTTSAGRPYFVMDLVKGVPITKYCDEHHLTPQQRLELFIPVCQAVQHAHQKGIIHRDLKPSNVLVALYDGKPVPKVIDFGVAKAAGQQLTEKTLVTGFGNIVGTLEYMSPEQAEINQLDIDTRSDIYSLGVLLYELLAGSPPFTRKMLERAGMLEMLRVIREQEPSKPSTKLSTAEGLPTLAANRGTEPAKLTRLVRGELDWIVMKALEKDRSRRYETANGFAADVQRYLADEPVLACPPSAGYRLKKFLRRNKVALVTTAVFASAVLVAVGGLAGSIGWAARDRAAQQKAAEAAVRLALNEADRLQSEGRFPEALSAARYAEGLLAGGLGSDDLRRRVRDRRADLEMALKMEDVRLEPVSAEHLGEEVQRYRKALVELGIDVEAMEPMAAADWIRRRSIPVELASFLDDLARIKWHVHGQGAGRNHLLAIARAADPDPWRNRLRDAEERRDRKALIDLAAEKEIDAQPPATLALLGLALYHSVGPEEAAAPLRRAQRHYPDDLWINYQLAFCLSRMRPRALDEELRYLTAAAALRPRNAVVHNNLGSAHHGQGRYDAAVAEYRKAIELRPDYALAHSNLGIALVDHKQGFDEAIAAERRAIELRPDFARPYYSLGNALRAKGQMDEAIAAYRKAIELNPEFADELLSLPRLAVDDREDFRKLLAELEAKVVPVARARYYISMSQWDKAATAYAKADLWVRPLPDDAFGYACLFLIRGDDEAYNRFCQGMIQRVAETKVPAPFEAYVLARGCAMARTSPVDPARAVQWANQAVASSPSPWYFHTLGLAQYRAGQFNEALRSFTKANVEAWSNREINWFGLALVHHRLAHPDEARQCLDKGVQWLERVSPPGPESPARIHPLDWLLAQLLRREAEEMQKVKRSP